MRVTRLEAAPDVGAVSGATDAHSTARRRKSTLRSFALFLLVGGLSYVVDASILLILSRVVGWPVWAAGSAGYVASIAVNFALNRALFHTGAPASGLGRQGLRYGSLLGANYVVTVAGLTASEALGIDLLLAKTVLVGTIAMWNFVLYRRWVFA